MGNVNINIYGDVCLTWEEVFRASNSPDESNLEEVLRASNSPDESLELFPDPSWDALGNKCR